MRVRDGRVSGYRQVQKKRCRGSRAEHLQQKTLRSPPQPLMLLLAQALVTPTSNCPRTHRSLLPTAETALDVAGTAFDIRLCASPTCISTPEPKRQAPGSPLWILQLPRTTPGLKTRACCDDSCCTLLQLHFFILFTSLLSKFSDAPSFCSLHHAFPPHWPHAHSLVAKTHGPSRLPPSYIFQVSRFTKAEHPFLYGAGAPNFAVLLPRSRQTKRRRYSALTSVAHSPHHHHLQNVFDALSQWVR